ncbi:PAAR domain-containing protein [Ruegeria sp. MALMAid1280]|uniref:PAAR domain-containing protein n=1 Tax=Ruegeria sp. MALMAid1280 TaxID=3411634 RepID=UPI003BA12CCE
MGKPAARLGDQTSHAGTPLGPGPGSVNVLIGGQPAWRAASDLHVCPLSDGPKPHVGGVVAVGSTTVLINNLPAARQGDQVIEAGAPNAILRGAPTVLIGG